MTPTKGCLICPNTNRNKPNMIFVQMPHPKKETRSRKAWFAVYADIVSYNEYLDCYLCSNHFDLKNDASNLDYYLTKRMKKLLFKPHALPKPLSIVTIEPPPLIKEEPIELDADDTIHIKEEPADVDEYEIQNDPIDIKIESRDELRSPSPPPLIPAAVLNTSDQQQQHPIVINSFQVANHQLRSQLLRLATQGRLRVVNVNNPTDASTTPTLAVLATDGMTVNTAAGVIQTGQTLTRHGPPRLLHRPLHVQMSPGQMQKVRMVNVQQAHGAGIGQQLIGRQKMVNVRPLNISVNNQQHKLLPPSVIQQITTNNSSILRHQLIVPKPTVNLTTPISQAPSLIPLPMRSVFACCKCTELFYTTNDRDRHIQNKHPGSLYSPVQQYLGGKTPQELVATLASARKVVRQADIDFTCEFCLVNLPSSQKIEHLATHETFKCVICHQTLEKRIYASHMMSHIENRPDTSESPPAPSKSRRKSSESTSSVQKSRYNVAHKKKSPPKISGVKALDNECDVTILEVKKAVVDHPDVEENLDEYMIPREKEKRLLNSSVLKSTREAQKRYFLQTCLQCKKNFCSTDLLIAHQEKEHKVAAFFTKCVYCLQYIDQTNLDQHVRTRHLAKAYSCPRCPVSFSHRRSCVNHIRIKHANDKDKRHLQPQSKRRRATAKQKEVSKSNVHVKTETRSESETVQEADMDYDEDYPLSMLVPKNSENNNFAQELREDEVEISCFLEDEGDDRPEYVDITEYNVID